MSVHFCSSSIWWAELCSHVFEKGFVDRRPSTTFFVSFDYRSGYWPWTHSRLHCNVANRDFLTYLGVP
jgi:hypothetical protein